MTLVFVQSPAEERGGWGTSASTPAEQPLDIAQRQSHKGRAAVIALAAVRRRLHLAQQRVHFRRREAAPGANARVAGERAANALDLLLQGRRLAPFGQLV